MNRLDDIVKLFRTAAYLGWLDVKQNYRRMVLGQVWVSLSLLLTTVTAAVAFSLVFGLELSSYLPHVFLGLLFWNLIVALLTESTTSLIVSEPYLKSLPLSYWTYVYRVVFKNLFIHLHNLAVVPIVFLISDFELSEEIPFFFLSFIFVIVSVIPVMSILATLTLVFRDLSQIVSSGLGVVFFMTPVLWKLEYIEDSQFGLLVNLNPLTLYLNLLRGPFFGQPPTLNQLLFLLLFTVFCWGLALIVHKLMSPRVVYIL